MAMLDLKQLLQPSSSIINLEGEKKKNAHFRKIRVTVRKLNKT